MLIANNLDAKYFPDALGYQVGAGGAGGFDNRYLDPKYLPKE